MNLTKEEAIWLYEKFPDIYYAIHVDEDDFFYEDNVSD